MATLLGEGTQAPIDIADWWINKVLTYGLGFIFTACVLLLLLWVAVTVVSLLKEWLPKWFSAQIDSFDKMCKRVDKLCETLGCVHETSHSIREGHINLTKAVRAIVKKNRERLGISSDVMIYLDNALTSYDVKPDHEHKGDDDDTQRVPSEQVSN